MHELSVAQNIVEACSERAGDTPVRRVTLEIGTLSCVLAQTLRFCFEVAAAGTPLEGSTLEIISVPAMSRCRDCGRDFAMTDILATCACGSTHLEPPVGGDGLKIKSMEVAPSSHEDAGASNLHAGSHIS